MQTIDARFQRWPAAARPRPEAPERRERQGPPLRPLEERRRALRLAPSPWPQGQFRIDPES